MPNALLTRISQTLLHPTYLLLQLFDLPLVVLLQALRLAVVFHVSLDQLVLQLIEP